MAYNNNNNNRYNDDRPVAFLVAHEAKDGSTYWKGTMDLGHGKAISFVMFENNKEGTKSDFILKGNKKKYNQNKQKNTW